ALPRLGISTRPPFRLHQFSNFGFLPFGDKVLLRSRNVAADFGRPHEVDVRTVVLEASLRKHLAINWWMRAHPSIFPVSEFISFSSRRARRILLAYSRLDERTAAD